MQPKSVPVIHQSDLFHPHADPDDHWDLACQYALALGGGITLEGILLDYPVDPSYGDPSIQAVNQLNYLTGLSVRCGVGLSEKTRSDADIDRMLGSGRGLSGVNMVLDILERSAEPVAIHIVGSCRDIAAAARRAPELFRTKCAALYLNAGSSNPESPMEYNVVLDPYTYALMFRLPCPVYWMPCFDMIREPLTVGEFGTFYKFRQGEILPELSASMQNFFLYALSRTADGHWLSALEQPVDDRGLRWFSGLYRNMWCTGGFLHTTGKTVLRSGEITELGAHPDEEVFRFEPVEVTCSNDGVTSWRMGGGETGRYLYRIADLERYEPAMITAMKTLLRTLP